MNKIRHSLRSRLRWFIVAFSIALLVSVAAPLTLAMSGGQCAVLCAGAASTPKLLFPVQPVAAVLGDSISQFNTNNATGNTASYQSQGYLSQARAYLGGRIRFPIALNFGITGQNSTQIAARVGTVIASGANIVFVEMGTNDGPQGIDPSTTVSNTESTVNQLLAAGDLVVVMPIMPRSVWTPLTGGQITVARENVYWINRQIRNYAYSTAAVGKLIVDDSDYTLLDQNSATGNPLAGTLQDGIHESNLGGDYSGLEISTKLSQFIPPLNPLQYSQADLYDTTNNPMGNRLGAIGYQIGTGGTAGTGVTGTVTSGASIQRTVGSQFTATASKVARTGVNNGTLQQLVFGAGGVGATTERIIWIRDLSSGATTWAVGDTVYLSVEMIGSSLVNIQNIGCFLQNNLSSGIVWGHLGTGIVADRILGNFTKTIPTPPFTIEVGQTNLRVECAIDAEVDGAAPSGTLQIGTMLLQTAPTTW